MANKTHKCCICGKKFTGWGNNPYGALDQNGNPIKFKDNDVCCDECDNTYVISGRLYLYAKACEEDKKNVKN